MDLIAPLAKTGVISPLLNLALAVPIGFVFGFALFHAGFTDSRRIAWAFYFKDVGVPVVMFSAIITGMLGLWGLGLLGVLDLSRVYFLPTYLVPMAIGGLLFGMGMAIGGYCPGTAAASLVTGKIDAMIFVVGFLIGSLVFGDWFPVWGEFYNSDYRGALRLDQLLDVNLGTMIFLIVAIAVAGALLMRLVQNLAWPGGARDPRQDRMNRLQGALVAAALVLALVMAMFPDEAFLGPGQEPGYYIVPKAQGLSETPATPGNETESQESSE